MQPSRKHVQHLARNVFTAQSQVISKTFIVHLLWWYQWASEYFRSQLLMVSKKFCPNSAVDPQCLNGQDKDLLVVSVITSEPGHKHEIYCTMEINGQSVKIKIDTSAKCNMTTINSFKKISCNEKIHLTKAVQLVACGSAVACAVGCLCTH